MCPLIRLLLCSNVPMDAFDFDVAYRSTKEAQKLEHFHWIGFYRGSIEEEEKKRKTNKEFFKSSYKDLKITLAILVLWYEQYITKHSHI